MCNREALPLEPRGASIGCDRGQILVVDDERAIAELFETILTDAFPDRHVDLATNGAEAVASFGRAHHAVLLMDLHMPVMDGPTAFSRIDRMCRERNWEMPAVVFCSGYAPPETVQKVVATPSPHCLLAKPVNEDTLVEQVRSRLV